MVRAGEFLERSVVVRVVAHDEELALDALYHRGRVAPPCVLASPHPALGGSMTSPVIAELAWALTRAGHATLRFDYRGVGGSQGTSRHPAGESGPLRPEALADERADLLAAADQLLATTGRPSLCAIGYSFGAAVALSVEADPRVERLVLVAPPTSLFDFSALRDVRKPLLAIVGHRDSWTDSATLRTLVPPGARFEVVSHADHFFGRGLTSLGKLVAGWLGAGGADQAAPEDVEATPEREIDLEPGDEPPLELDTDR